MTHLSEEDLVLHHFGEGEASAAGEAHLAQCAECREALAALRRDLGAVSLPEPPARGEDYGAQVWARIQPQIQPRVRRHVFARRAWVPLAMAASLVLAFLLGRHWPHDPPPGAVTTAARERILLVAVGDHLERSAMLLVELANAGDEGKPVDISAQQEWAEELVGENRLYRQTLVRSGEPGAAACSTSSSGCWSRWHTGPRR